MEYIRMLFSENPEFLGIATLVLVAFSWLAFIALVLKERKKEGDKNG